MKSILVRYGELTLKGSNRDIFIDKLNKNIKFKLKPFKSFFDYKKDRNSLELEIIDEKYIDQILEELKTVFGIHSMSIAHRVGHDSQEIIKKVMEIAPTLSGFSFKIEVLRKDKSFKIPSDIFKREIASEILKTIPNITVDVKNPQKLVNVLIKNNNTYIYIDKIQGLKGLPVGTSGRGISMISGGIDSPVASYLALKRGMKVDFLHFMTPPHTTPEAVQKVFDLIKVTSKYNVRDFNFYVCDFSMLLKELMHMKNDSYRITIMRRVFLIIANKLADKIEAQAIITGDALGQVASQTIDSMNVIGSVSERQILRPLITYDKEEIIKISEYIGAYPISILPFDDVCSMYVPNKPIIKPTLKEAEFQEKELMLDVMIDKTLKDSIKKYYLKDGEWFEAE
ncbi:thiamine biosynthesis protein ThiI [Spiroplasma sp. TIUS-1]|uniref:tRNA uracil 4-sulfurtransferase ThiI n=1 Tax=Spiroplasma sp. TIUS-1 TaxID=216963 RepID=UPI0013995EDA|nr:tRNA uracil 4-sulfurtransferase ThiI [Spiroplasma sp. TIUS-1]QHX36102.1 thiamine biosynthesis protein ThiI [Spiroplasma sp. TIUS-1]